MDNKQTLQEEFKQYIDIVQLRHTESSLPLSLPNTLYRQWKNETALVIEVIQQDLKNLKMYEEYQPTLMNIISETILASMFVREKIKNIEKSLKTEIADSFYYRDGVS